MKIKNFTKSANNNIAVYGYNTKSDKFMTVHASSEGLFTATQLFLRNMGTVLFKSFSEVHKTLLLNETVNENVLYETSVIRVDMGAGRAHVQVGAGLPNIFIPVNFTEDVIAYDQYAYVISRSDSGDVLVLLERCGRIDYVSDIRELYRKADMLAKAEAFDNCKMIQIGDLNIYIRTNDIEELFDVSPFTTQGRRILACVKGLYGISIAPVSDVTISEKTPCNISTKICYVDGKFHKWTYIADEKVIKEEISLPEYKNTGTAILVSVKNDADIHGVIFKLSDGKYDDVVLTQDKYVKIQNDGNILEYLYGIHLDREARRRLKEEML